jgi:hypothetical protein
VTLVDAWAEQVETIRRQGIAVTGPHDPFIAPFRFAVRFRVILTRRRSRIRLEEKR